MFRHIIHAGAALILLPLSSYIAKLTLWVTAATHWYPPAQDSPDPQEALTKILAFAFAVLFVAEVLLVLFLAVTSKSGEDFLTRPERSSWTRQYTDEKRTFAALIAKARDITVQEANELITKRFATPQGERFFALTRDPQTREALRAWRHLIGDPPLGLNLHLGDKDPRGDRAQLALRRLLREELITYMDEANPTKTRWSVEITPPLGMTANAIESAEVYLSSRGYTHTVIPRMSGTVKVDTAPRVTHGDWLDTYFTPGGSTTVFVYLDSGKDPHEADAEISALALILTAAPLARLPLSVSPEEIREAQTQVKNLATVLAMRGFAPGEFSAQDSFTGMVDPDQLAQWAVSEIVLDTTPDQVVETR